jgi:hypothetical protein
LEEYARHPKEIELVTVSELPAPESHRPAVS